MPIKKIEAGRVITQTIDTFIGIEGTIFYDEQTGELRLSDGETPGGFSIGGGGSGYILPKASDTRLGGIKVGNELSISNTGTLNVVLSAVGQAIIPNLDAEYSIGTPELRWKDIYVSTGSVYIGDLKLSNDSGTLLLGSATNSDVDPHTILRGELDVNDYVSLSVRNLNTGTLASADIILYQGGSEGDHLADFGIASDNYAYPGYSIIEAGDTYLIGTGGNVKIGTRTTGTDIVFFAGGSDSSDNEIARFSSTQGLVLSGNLVFADGSTMSTANTGSGGNGYTGSQGIIGYTGSAGIDGTIGYNGSDGYTGSQGDVGYTGSQGNIGYTGSNGNVGYTGSKGTDGTSVVIVGSVLTSNDLAISYAGSTGDGYITQDTGHLWVWSSTLWVDVGAIKGPTGDTGYTGSQGEIGYTGSVGDTGYTGSQGEIGYTGSQGYTGSVGDIGYTGSQGDIGYTGSHGVTGYIGSQGDQGYTGSQGTIGYTGSIGDTGFVGSQGYTGSQGDQGYTGSQGDIGYAGSVGYIGSSGYTGSKGEVGIFAGTEAPVDTTYLWLDTDETINPFLPSGGDAGQALIKSSNTDYDYIWGNVASTGSGGIVGGYVSSLTAGTGTVVSTSTGGVTVWMNTSTLVAAAVDASNLRWITSSPAPADPFQTIVSAESGAASITLYTGLPGLGSSVNWIFDTTKITFPDATKQTTAWTGTYAASALTLTDNTLASNVVTSSLTSVGTLTGLTVGGTGGDLVMTGGAITGVGNITATGTVAVNAAGGITTTALAFDIVNGTATTVNIGGAATAVNIGSTAAGTLTLNNPTIVGSSSTQVLFNTVATTINAFGAASALTIGATGGTLTLRNPTIVGSQTTQNLFNTVATTINAFGAATAITIGATTGTTSIRNSLALTHTPATATGYAIVATGKDTQGGTGYFDILKATNATSGVTNPNKSFRLTSDGQYQIINSAYTANILNLTDAGNFSVPGTISVNYKQAVNGPAFSAYASAILQTIPNNAQTKVLFQTEEFDTNSNYTNSRFTPTVEGYYQLNAEVRLDGASGTGEMMIILYKNGSEYKRGTNQQGTQIAANFWAMQVSSMAYANGSTDYFEIYVQQGSGSSVTVTAVNATAITWFNGCMLRGA